MSRCHSGWAFLVLAAVWTLLPPSASAQRPRFSIGALIPIDAGVDAGPQAVAVGDLNKDGNPDIVVVAADEMDGPIAVVMNQGNGTFAAPTLVSDEGAVLDNPVAVAIADVGSPSAGPDGNNDIIAIDDGGGFLVLFGDGTGNFTIETDLIPIEGLDTPVGVAVGDFDGKNGPDLAIIDDEGDNGGQVFFLCNVGQAALFEPCPTMVFDSGGDMPIDVGTGDFNGDGHADVVVLNQGLDTGQGNVALFTGNADGSFTLPRQQTFPVANEPRDLAVANLNPGQDTIDDVAVGEFESLGNDNVTILLGGTTGAIFTRPNKAILELDTTSIAVGNFVGDDSPDLAGTNDPMAGSSTLTVATGDGTGAFSDPQQGGTISGGGASMGVGRFDNDDLDDLVVLNLDSNAANFVRGIRVALNTSTSGGTETPGTPMPGTATPTPTPTQVATPELQGCEVGIIPPSQNGLVASVQADFDRDGVPDVAVIDHDGKQVVVLLTDASLLRDVKKECAFKGENARYPLPAEPTSIAAQDLDGDGRVDLAVATASGISILRASEAEGSFVVMPPVATGGTPRAVAIADFDGNRVMDLTAANGTNVVILLATTPLAFATTPSRQFNVAGGLAVVAADLGGVLPNQLNGDGWPDLAVATDTGAVHIFLQNPSSPGMFPGTPPNAVNLTGGTPTAMIAAQTNSSPALELLVTMAAPNGDGTFVTIRRSGSQYAAGAPIKTDPSPSAVAIGEFVASTGLTDVLVTSPLTNTVSFFPGNADGTFGAATSSSSVGSGPSSLVTGDFDHDGKIDIVVTNKETGSVTLLLSSRVPPTPTPTTTNTPTPTNIPTNTGTPGPSLTATVGSPGPTATPKLGAFSLSSCNIGPTGTAGRDDGTLLVVSGAVLLWFRRTRIERR